MAEPHKVAQFVGERAGAATGKDRGMGQVIAIEIEMTAVTKRPDRTCESARCRIRRPGPEPDDQVGVVLEHFRFLKIDIVAGLGQCFVDLDLDHSHDSKLETDAAVVEILVCEREVVLNSSGRIVVEHRRVSLAVQRQDVDRRLGRSRVCIVRVSTLQALVEVADTVAVAVCHVVAIADRE